MDASGLDRTLLVEVGLRLHFGPLAGISWVHPRVPTPSGLFIFMYIESRQLP